VAVALSVVQRFVAQARSTSDVSVASAIYSALGERVARTLSTVPRGELVLPGGMAIPDSSASPVSGAEPGSGMPNRVVALIPPEGGTTAAEQAVAAVREEWQGRGGSARDLVVVTVRGVQTFIGEARSTADLHAGSSIISALSAAMVKAVQFPDHQAELVMPSPDGQGGVPNRVAVLVATGQGRGLAEHMADAAHAAWRDLAKEGSVEDSPDFPDIQWVVAEADPAGYTEQWMRASAALAARKRIRSFVFPPDSQVRVCALTGRWKALPAQKSAWNVRADEALSLPGHVKRKFSRDAKQGFPSTWSFASAPYRAAIIEKAGQEPELHEAVAALHEYVCAFLGEGCTKQDRDKITRPSAVPPGIPQSGDPELAWLRSIEGSWCTPTTWEPAVLRASYELDALPDADTCHVVRIAAHELARAAASLGIAPLTPYLAVVAQDADHMGQQLAEFPDHLDPIAWHKDISAALMSAAGSQRNAIERAGVFGRVVYAGGDDLLALTPAATALGGARAANSAFRSTLSGVLEEPSASVAIVYIHASWPLQSAVLAVQDLLKEAKNVRRPGLGIAVERRGGERSRLLVPWQDPANPQTPMIDHLEALAASMAGSYAGLSGRLASELERDRAALATLSPEWLERELLRRNARHGGVVGGDALLALSYEESSGRRRLPVDAVSVARFLAAETLPAKSLSTETAAAGAGMS
jgi:hypothetical protein